MIANQKLYLIIGVRDATQIGQVCAVVRVVVLLPPAVCFAWLLDQGKHSIVWDGRAFARQDVRTKLRVVQGSLRDGVLRPHLSQRL